MDTNSQDDKPVETGVYVSDEQNDIDYWTIEAMEKYGGSFVKALANLARRADPVNLQQIKFTWSEYWRDYERKGFELQKENESK